MSVAAVQHGERLESVFSRIQRERMADVPILNDALRVQWIEHGADDDACLGILITPWFMSLLRLPLAGTDWSDSRPGEEVVRHYPSGQYRFLVNEEPGIGHYQACSLFSPVFEFAEQGAAEETAIHALAALFDEAHQSSGDIDSEDLVARWHPEAADDAVESELSPPDEPAEDKDQSGEIADPGRRGFLTGGLSAGGAP